MKNYKTIVPIALIACLLLSFYMLFDARMSAVNEYNSYLTEARSKAEQGIAVDALENYTKALGVKNTLAVQLEVGEFLVKMNDVSGAITWGERMIEAFPKSEKSFEYLLTRYRDVNDYNRCFALANTISKRKLSSDKITEIMDGIKYQFYYGEAYDDVKVYSQGYCAVQYEGKWGLADQTGKKVAPTKYASIGMYINGLAPATTEEGETFFIDKEGNKKMVAMIEGEIIDLQSPVADVYAAFNGNVWSFYNINNEKIGVDYANITLPSEDVLAVENGGKWSIVNGKFETIGGTDYTDVVKDERNIVYRNGALFVNNGGVYTMVDKTGNQIGSNKFLDAQLFLDQTYAAVKTENGWTFVNNKGELVLNNEYYEEAHSFMNGFAAVKKNGLWGFIDMQGNVAIDYQYADAKDFNAAGCAFIKDEEIWRLIRLYSKNYES